MERTLTPMCFTMASPLHGLNLPILSTLKINSYKPHHERQQLIMSSTKTSHQVQMPAATDLYNIDHLLSEEERMVRDTVRKFVGERVLPIIGDHFEAGTFPRQLIPAVAALGLLGM